MPTDRSRTPKEVVRASIIILLLMAPVSLATTGCAEPGADAESTEEVLQEQADRQDEAVDEPVEVMDDERSVERRVRDATTAAKIRTALVEEKELRRFDFEPVVVNGRVLLRGEVSTQDQRRRAAAVAEGIDGVSSVINEVAATAEPTPAESGDAARDSMIARMDEAAKPAATGDTASAAEPSEADSQDQPSTSAADDGAVYHTVRSGESLWIIANNNGVTIDQIRQLNNLRSDKLKPGQRLRVK